jgi:hypothetical protein
MSRTSERLDYECFPRFRIRGDRTRARGHLRRRNISVFGSGDGCLSGRTMARTSMPFALSDEIN